METAAEREQRVTSLELFFDLVFVFAITQVTGLLSNDTTWAGLARGLLLLGALWWAWAAYAWLTNTVDPEEGGVRIAMLGAMGAMLVVSLAVPGAFDADGVVFGVAYLAVRVLHLVLYALASRGDPDLLGAVVRIVPTAVAGPALILTAASFDGVLQGGLWAAALAIDYLGVLIGRGEGWRVSASHFAERHGLIVIIALGESIVALGVGAAGLPLDAGLAATALLGMVVVSVLWWAYFDFAAIVGERLLRDARGAAQATLARDLYSYLHMPLVAGIVLFALGLKKTMANHADALDTIPAVGLCGGLSLFMLVYVVWRIRVQRRLSRGRLAAGVVFAALTPVALHVPALLALALAAGVGTTLITYEVTRFREDRAQIRSRGELPAEAAPAPRS
jgi:low temperature requirement protein LtrA